MKFLGGHLLHICRGCCANRAESVEKGVKIIQNSLLRAVSVPALNKWTKVFPCAGAVVLLTHFHALVRDAFKAMFGALSEQDESDSEEGSEDKALAVPVNEAKRWRKLARKRNKKATHFILDEECGFLNMLWLFISSPVMTLHWSLFRNATWYTDRPEPAERADGKDKVHQMAAFCDPGENPALKVIEESLKLLTQTDEQLRVMYHFYGGFEAWSQERKCAFRLAVLVTMGQLVRKLIEPFLEYPWRLWPMCSSKASVEQRQECAQQLLDACSCCCDPGFSGRLRSLTVQELLEERRQQFLELVFSRLVLTSTFIERKFANFTKWTGKAHSLQLLAAKHYTRAFTEAATKWRAKSGFKPGHKKGRPTWCGSASKPPRLNGYHVFTRERRDALGGNLVGADSSRAFLEQVTAEWGRLSAAQKRAYGAMARGENARADLLQQAAAAAEPQPLQPGGPWGLSYIPEKDGPDWPLSAEVMRKSLEDNRGFRSECRAWAEAASKLQRSLRAAHTSAIGP